MTATQTITIDAVGNPVKAATIFQSSTAELTRAFSADLKSGRNVIEIRNISSQVDVDSPRIHGLGQYARVFDITCASTLAWAPGTKPSRHSESMKKLSAKKKALEADRTLRNQEIDMLTDATKKSKCGEDKAAHLAFMDGLVQRKREAVTVILQLAEQIDEIEREMWLLENTHKGDTAVVVTATIFARRECQVEFQLTYLVSGASWKPSYDLHATTSEGKTSSDVSLVYCANITQSTGEDWSETVLTLSTANSQARQSLSVPSIDPLKLTAAHSFPTSKTGFTNNNNNRTGLFGQMAQQSNAGGLFGSAQTQSATFGSAQTAGLFGASAFGQAHAPPPPPAPAVAPQPPQDDFDDDAAFVEVEEELDAEGVEKPGAVLDRSPLSLAYRVEGAVMLPSDGLGHKIAIATLDFKAALKYLCVPRKTAAVFIEGRVENTSEYELLAGPVSVFMDNGFVTKTSLGLIGVNQSFNCVLGVDTALRVSYNTKNRAELEAPHPFAERSKTTTRTITTTITNGHSFDIDGLVVRDALPLGNEPAKIHVHLREPEGLARAHDGEDIAVKTAGDAKDAKVRWVKGDDGKSAEKDGLYEWVCGIPAGKKARLEVVCDFKMPAAVRWQETSAR
ncbi:uncharacterized protein BXZ73DRAFT_46355 [Epithele typhae]|uniref:uncharacterized protein n=1 Tax=Epithele typhae TaxID=378194 RepID=UPI0020074F3B|nr:uncharacterized protein BXZ73DRAFT_46355 [Epithele typhae]KAH9933566.1 hypothetical protein BXZ73DRAFT_46355 [Epithele typhae]